MCCLCYKGTSLDRGAEMFFSTNPPIHGQKSNPTEIRVYQKTNGGEALSHTAVLKNQKVKN